MTMIASSFKQLVLWNMLVTVFVDLPEEKSCASRKWRGLGIYNHITSLIVHLFFLLNKEICVIYEIILNAFLFLYEKINYHKNLSEYMIWVAGHAHVAEALGVPLHIFFTMPWTWVLTLFFFHSVVQKVNSNYKSNVL